MSETLKNIKIPYPTEGVIRSAQINDTVTPENSVQLAINANFDRIGAIITRLGLTQAATPLNGSITQLSSLNYNATEVGYSNISLYPDSTSSIGQSQSSLSTAKIDDTHILYVYSGTSGSPSNDKGYARVISVDSHNGDISAIGSEFNFETAQCLSNSVVKIDANHFINFWTIGGSPNGGYAQVFEVNLSTWAITAIGSKFTFEPTVYSAFYNNASKIDTNHFINFWNANGIGKSQVFEVNLSTWVITAKGTSINYETLNTLETSSAVFSNGLHVINFWAGATIGYTQVFEVNASTYQLTAKSTKFIFDSVYAEDVSCASFGDDNHFILFWKNRTDKAGYSRVFTVNSTTYAVTTAGPKKTFDQGTTTQSHGSYNACLKIDTNKFVDFWQSFDDQNNLDKNCARIFEVNPTDYSIKGIGATSIDPNPSSYPKPILIEPYYIFNISIINGSSVGPVNAKLYSLSGDNFTIDILFAQISNGDVYKLQDGIWTLARTDVSSMRKARFSQFLNYLWMVNGGSLFGNEVATSNGGQFGPAGVPVNFPPGDYISAGFDGRIIVADKASDTLWYTDIVQFTPPNTYTLTFNKNVNYIKNFSPQDGESITGLQRVPRALLVFKENHIYRVYAGMTTDAYPAYNVGTYSQESIVETKSGIFFHHSSGFYQFDYAGQPIELSRRVIDFVKAIPRSYYENITGVWDGFDTIKWMVGTVTVEGVTFKNCVMRYTISTQVWTVYDYENNNITAMGYFDTGTELKQIGGDSNGNIFSIDEGLTDLGKLIYYDIIDRWRSFTEMYSNTKSISGLMVMTENAAGANLCYQTEKTPVDKWQDIDTVKDEYDALFPNASTDDFNNIRLRLKGHTKGTPMIFHGMEILSVQNKGLNEN